MECLIGWNFKLKKQTSLGIFGKFFSWCDTTEEQARFTLHSCILLFIAMFDALVTLLWSNCEKVREEAQKELVEFLKKTMSSTYDLVEEDFIHETPSSTSNIQEDFITTDPSEIDLVVDPHIDEGQTGTVTCSKKLGRILPTPICKNNLLQLRHESSCHVFKGFVGKCAVCGERFTTSKLSWNAIKLWNDQCSVKSSQPYFENDVIFPLSKEQVDIVALRISYDMEYFSIHPNDTLKKMLFTIVLNHFNEHDYCHRKGCFKKTSDCRFHYPRTIKESHELKIDFKVEPSIWYTSYGNGENKTCYLFTMESKSALPDVLLNTNNPIISEVFGFNNNVTMGNRNCIYYVTLYNTKGNQEEEQFPFLKHCTSIAKHLRKLRNQERERLQEI
jgi:hypothetical protein